MRLLLTSDWQADFSNLQECETSLEELLEAAARYKPAAIIHCGDLKEAYSPIDTEVVKFCVRAVRRVCEAGYRFIILLGNHDRVSQSAESKDWLDVMQAAGAEVVTRPAVKKVGNLVLACLPYMALGQDTIRAAQALLRSTQRAPGAKILLFHTELAGSELNSAGRVGVGPTAEELGFSQYTACFGGHIHKHQKIDQNGWYVGAPFCQDWGDANSSRGHLLVEVFDDARKWVKVTQLRTKIPHWYDVEYLEKNGIIPEPGAYVRSRVNVTSRKITDQMREEEERIRKAYGDVRIHTVPELVDDAPAEMVLKGATDREKIEQYVAATITEQHRFEPMQAVSYMTARLAGTKEAAQGGELYFNRVEADNVLVFEHVAMRLAKLGLVLIRGENQDWPGRSNGTGKSSLLSLTPIAMFGTVPNKKQRSDAWAYERNEDQASVKLTLMDAAKRKIEISRGRRPHFISLRIDGEDKSAGIRGLGKNETQGLIERATGYDIQMLMNAVYIDQAVANGFVFGTPAGRMDLIARFQNLERFEEGLKRVNEDYKKWEMRAALFSNEIETFESEIANLQAELKELAEQAESDWAEQLRHEQSNLDNLIEEHAAIAGVAITYEELQRSLDDLEKDRENINNEITLASRQAGIMGDRLGRGRKLIESGKCPTCLQPSTGAGEKIVAQAERQLLEAQDQEEKRKRDRDLVKDRIDAARKKLTAYNTRRDDLNAQIKRARERLGDLEKAAADEAERNAGREAKIRRKSLQLGLQKRYRRAAIAARQEMSVGVEMLEYVKKAFQRSGIPLYLSVSLCPLLNKAAEEYSEIFTDGNLKVSFRVEDGEFAVDVVNPVGSSTVEGQSEGESAMAGLIAAFALREAAPKTNMLILDEPGTKLDPEGCKQFARGILRLKDHFETILLVTHSPYISSLLSGETVYTVKKRNGRSRLFLSSSRESVRNEQG